MLPSQIAGIFIIVVSILFLIKSYRRKYIGDKKHDESINILKQEDIIEKFTACKQPYCKKESGIGYCHLGLKSREDFTSMFNCKEKECKNKMTVIFYRKEI